VLIVEKKQERLQSFESIPGIGGYLASVILAECGDLRRFNNEGQFSSYIGLVPGMYNSGESEKCLGIAEKSVSIAKLFS
jgi:transposase